jgi:hypothetical protein
MIARIKTGVQRRLLEALRNVAERYLDPFVRKIEMKAPCVRCGCKNGFLVNTRVKPDFDVSTVEPVLLAALLDQKDYWRQFTGRAEEFVGVVRPAGRA